MAHPKINNAKHGRKAKVEIRRHVLEALTPSQAVVFDAFAGTGVMWGEVWKDAAGYVGCDQLWHNDARLAYVADNRRVLRAINLRPFTVFDFDAYGSPWDQVGILAARRPLLPHERIGLILTEGTWMKTRTRDPIGALREVLPSTVVTPIPPSVHDQLILRALRNFAAKMGGTITQLWHAIGTSGARVRYIGAVIAHQPPEQKPRLRRRATQRKRQAV